MTKNFGFLLFARGEKIDFQQHGIQMKFIRGNLSQYNLNLIVTCVSSNYMLYRNTFIF